MKSALTALAVLFILPTAVQAVEPAEVVVVFNRSMSGSKEVADFYCQKRGVPAENLVALDLPTGEDISYSDYQAKLIAPLRSALKESKDRIKVLLCVYGVPLRVGPDTPGQKESTEIVNLEKELKDLENRKKKLEQRLKELDLTAAGTTEKTKTADELKQVQASGQKLHERRRWLSSGESTASVDSELMHLWWDGYERRRFQLNLLHFQVPKAVRKAKSPLIMTARLDGPTPEIAKRLVADAVEIEKVGLIGKVYVDARDQRYDPKADTGYGYGGYDESMREMASLLKDAAKLDVILDNKPDVFTKGSCPDCALYCGWYSHGNFVDSCKFVQGAVGWHLASSEAVSLRRKNSTLWCQRILEAGACATMGPVAEPYTVGFPKPAEFFGFLVTGEFTLVECYARTLNLTSWMCTLIGDPLYNPFKANSRLKSSQVQPSPKGGKFLLGTK